MGQGQFDLFQFVDGSRVGMNARQLADLQERFAFEVIRPHQIVIEDNQMNDASGGLTFLLRQSTEEREENWSKAKSNARSLTSRISR